jgi:hypothetical protein
MAAAATIKSDAIHDAKVKTLGISIYILSKNGRKGIKELYARNSANLFLENQEIYLHIKFLICLINDQIR